MGELLGLPDGLPGTNCCTFCDVVAKNRRRHMLFQRNCLWMLGAFCEEMSKETVHTVRDMYSMLFKLPF